ncbi:MAG: phospholipid carrier-dependent glycosyltransferase [Thermomicrobiales bacterium]
MSRRGLPGLSPRGTLIPVCLFTITLWHLLPGVTTTPFHRDEARWVHRVYYLQEWRHPLGERWQDDGYPIGTGSWDERFRMSGQPPLAPYLFGIGLLVQGRDLTTNGFWNMDRDPTWNVEHGNMPETADLRAARRTNVVIAGLIVVAVYLLGARITNRAGGVIGALFLAFHPLVVDAATRAWSDPALILCLALAALAAYHLGERPGWGRALILGILLGLGGAAKLSPLLLAGGIAGVGVLLILVAVFRRMGLRGSRRLGWMLLVQPLIAWLTFVAAYPYLWPDPIAQTRRLFDFRTDAFRLQGQAWPNSAVENRTEALDRAWRLLTADWASTGGWIAERVGTMADLRYLDLSLALVGGLMLAWLVWRRGLGSGTGLAASLLGGQVALTILAMRIDYARYHLSIVLVAVVGISVASGCAWNAIVASTCRLHQRSSARVPVGNNQAESTQGV